MAIDLINESKLTAYINELVYQGVPPKIEQHLNGEFESADYVMQHKDVIAKGIVKQYIRRHLRDYMTAIENEPAFVLVDRNDKSLPGWVETVFAKGKKVYDFDATKMSDKLRNEIITVRDILYSFAEVYVKSVVEMARQTKEKPKIDYGYLKKSNISFEYILNMARSVSRIKNNKSKEGLTGQEIEFFPQKEGSFYFPNNEIEFD